MPAVRSDDGHGGAGDHQHAGCHLLRPVHRGGAARWTHAPHLQVHDLAGHHGHLACVLPMGHRATARLEPLYS